MKRRVLLALLAVAVIAGLVWYVVQWSYGRDAFCVTLHGKVVDEKGRRVGGIEVRYVKCCGTGVLAKTVTGRDGSFVFPEFDAEPLSQGDRGCFVAFMRGKYIGWKLGPAWGDMLPTSIANESFNITVSKPTTREVIVVDTNGSPVSGTDVSVSRIDYEHERTGFRPLQDCIHLEPSVTDAAGKVRIVGVPAGSQCRCWAAKPGFAPVPGLSTYDKVVIARTGKVVGRILTKSGKPVSGATVQIDSDDTETGEDGSYELDVLPGKHDITVYGAWIDKAHCYELPVRAGATTRHDFKVGCAAYYTAEQLKKRVTLSGVVVDEITRKPLPNIWFQTESEFTNSSRDHFWDLDHFTNELVETDKHGRFKTSVMPGRIRILSFWDYAYYSDVDLGRGSIVANRNTTGLTLFARRSRIVRGCVRDEKGRPVADAIVCTTRMKAVTDKRGDFAFAIDPRSRKPGISAWLEALTQPESKYKIDNSIDLVAVTADGKLGGYRRFDNGLPDKGIAITVKPARSLAVSVKDESGKPFKGVNVVCSSEHCSYPRLAAQDTSPAGKAKFEPLYEGIDYKLSCCVDGYDYLSTDLPDVGSRNWSARQQITLKRPDRTITGVVLDRARKPVAGAKIRLGYSDQASATTDADGLFVCHGVYSGAVHVQAVKGNLGGEDFLGAGQSSVTIIVYGDE